MYICVCSRALVQVSFNDLKGKGDPEVTREEKSCGRVTKCLSIWSRMCKNGDFFAWRGCHCRNQILAMSLTKSNVSSTSFNPPLLLTEWMSPHYKFKSTNLRAPSPPGSVLWLCSSASRGWECTFPSFSISVGLCPGVLLWDLGFEQWKTQSQTLCCIFAVSEGTSKSAVCMMSFYFTTQLLPNKNGCSFGELSLPHRL